MCVVVHIYAFSYLSSGLYFQVYVPSLLALVSSPLSLFVNCTSTDLNATVIPDVLVHSHFDDLSNTRLLVKRAY